jgi:hypothetical protein
MTTTSISRWMVERITDISNDLCEFVDNRSNNIDKRSLIQIYEYHKGNNDIYPFTNWHAHRIRCMSSIASRLRDNVRIWECHFWILKYYFHLSRCDCHCMEDSPVGVNHDFFHRDSLSYLVYGSQAVVNACIYLFPFTKYPYYIQLIQPIVVYLDPYVKRKKFHIEYMRSEVESDKRKPEYGKRWDPNYARTFLRLAENLKSMR